MVRDFFSWKKYNIAILFKNVGNVVLEPIHPFRCLGRAAYSGGLKHNSLYDPFSEDLSCLVSSQVASSELKPGRKHAPANRLENWLIDIGLLTAVLFQCIRRWWFFRMSGDLLTSCSASFTAGMTPCPILVSWYPRVVGKNPARKTSCWWCLCRFGWISNPNLPPWSTLRALAPMLMSTVKHTEPHITLGHLLLGPHGPHGATCGLGGGTLSHGFTTCCWLLAGGKKQPFDPAPQGRAYTHSKITQFSPDLVSLFNWATTPHVPGELLSRDHCHRYVRCGCRWSTGLSLAVASFLVVCCRGRGCLLHTRSSRTLARR